jgi:cation diffusion facilitator family transporter
VICERSRQADVHERLIELLEEASYPARAVDQHPFGQNDAEIEVTLYATAVVPEQLDEVMARLEATPGVVQAFWKDADEDHPYGHHRYETAASLVLGLLLLGVGLGMLGSAITKLQQPEAIPQVHMAALWVALGALTAKELLFRYMLAVAKRVKSSMLVANAWHARSDAASSLVVGIGIIGNLAGYPILDPIAAAIVGFMVARMGWEFGWDALHDLMDRAVDEEEVAAIRSTLAETPGIMGVHDVRTRKMGDMVVVDAHIEVDATLTVEAGHEIAVEARRRVLQRHRVLNLMTHVDPWRRPDGDHDAVDAATRA